VGEFCMAVTDHSISWRLKQETRIQHERAERHRLPQALREGRLPRGLYADWLAQRLLLHRVLEKEAAASAHRSPIAHRVMQCQQGALGELRIDLAFLGGDPASIRADAAAAKLVTYIERTAKFNPIALLGICYVLHVTSGGPHASAQRLHRAYQLRPGPGTLYVESGGNHRDADVCGVEQAIDTARLSRLDAHALVATARTTYILLAELEDDLFCRAMSKHGTEALAAHAGRPRVTTAATQATPARG
jgi:hypothetical protein